MTSTNGTTLHTKPEGIQGNGCKLSAWAMPWVWLQYGFTIATIEARDVMSQSSSTTKIEHMYSDANCSIKINSHDLLIIFSDRTLLSLLKHELFKQPLYNFIIILYYSMVYSNCPAINNTIALH